MIHSRRAHSKHKRLERAADILDPCPSVFADQFAVTSPVIHPCAEHFEMGLVQLKTSLTIEGELLENRGDVHGMHVADGNRLSHTQW